MALPMAMEMYDMPVGDYADLLRHLGCYPYPSEDERSLSPTSTKSDSSGVSSLALSTEPSRRKSISAPISSSTASSASSSTASSASSSTASSVSPSVESSPLLGSSPMSSRSATPTDDCCMCVHGCRMPRKRMAAIGTGRKKHKQLEINTNTRIPWEVPIVKKNDFKRPPPIVKRDILDLSTNITFSRWPVQHPAVSHLCTVQHFLDNRSIYFRLSHELLTEDYPTRKCEYCDFLEPSPYLCP